MAEPDETTRPTQSCIPQPRNGVDTPSLFATIDAVGAQRDLARFTFRASNRWIRGTQSRSRTEAFSGAGGVHEHKQVFEYDSDHPSVLCGAGNGPTPIEYLLGALASCLTAGIANIAAARGISLDEVQSTVEGDANLLGLLGLDDRVRNGYESIRIRFSVRGNASAAKLRQVVEQARKRSAVFDVLTNSVPVTIDVVTAEE